MKQRGRKSAASKLAVIDGGRGSRAAPPGDLCDYQAAKWAEIVGAMPADWFQPEMTDLLRAYCRVSKICYKLDKMLDQLDDIADNPEKLSENDGVKDAVFMIKVTAQRDKQVRQLAMLATKMRLTPQSRQEPKTAGNRRAKAREQANAQPWDG